MATNTRRATGVAVGLFVFVLSLAAAPAAAEERLCDTSFENCRSPLLNLINNETVGIDVAFWFMEDTRYSNALIQRFQAGVRVRVLMDTRANPAHPINAQIIDELEAAGIPLRRRTHRGILHWKMMLFAGQNQVEFSAANFSGAAFVPIEPYKNYVHEAIYFSDDPAVVNSFKTKYDDLWTNTSDYADYANVATRQREYPTFAIDPALNFPPDQDYGARAVKRYNDETQQIDVTMFRLTDARHTDAVINAINRGVRVRLLIEPAEYRSERKFWTSRNIDEIWAAGGEVRERAHIGQVHQKSVVLHSQGMTIFGSSNWTSASSKRQQEHNYFTTKSWFFQWFADQFERKWTNATGNVETKEFVPLPPDDPVYQSPADGATDQPTDVTVKWYAGLFAHLYDVYLGTSPTTLSPVATDLHLGPSKTTSDLKKYTLPPLNEGTTYYWQIVSKTMADKAAAGPVWSFTTAGEASAPPPDSTLGEGDILLYAGSAPVVNGDWRVVSDSTAAGAVRIVHPDAGGAKIKTALSSPTHYFEMSFEAEAGTPYHLWLRTKAENNHYANDSVHVQFSGSVDSGGNPIYRIGTTDSAPLAHQACDGCPISGWGWEDNGWNGVGPDIFFASSGTQTIRIQTREDGLSIDQIMLSPDKFRSSAPGAVNDDTTIYPESSSGSSPPPSGEFAEIVLHAEDAPLLSGAWRRVDDSSAAGGTMLNDADAGVDKINPALADPSHYFEMQFQADTSTAYHLWLRLRADGDHWANDSVHVQFSSSVNSGGSPIYRISTADSAQVVLQGCNGCTIAGWGWQDQGWNGAGPHIFFEGDGPHTLRVQTREDAVSVDQIVLSAADHLTSAPGPRTNDSTIVPKTQSGDGGVLTANPVLLEGQLALHRPDVPAGITDVGL